METNFRTPPIQGSLGLLGSRLSLRAQKLSKTAEYFYTLRLRLRLRRIRLGFVR